MWHCSSFLMAASCHSIRAWEVILHGSTSLCAGAVQALAAMNAQADDFVGGGDG